MVSRVQERVIQQGLRDPRAIAEGAGPSTSTLLGVACSPPTAHWFLLVGRGRQCVVTSIIRIGMSSPSHQIRELQPRSAEPIVEPDTEVVQRHPRRQSGTQALDLMGTLPPQAEGVEELVVDRLYDLTYPGDPPPQRLGPGLFGVALGWMDQLRPVALEPAAMVFGALEALVGNVSPREGRAHAPQPGVRIGPEVEEGLGQRLVGRRGSAETKARDHPGGIDRGEQRETLVPAQAVGPADVGPSGEPSMPPALGIPDWHSRAIQRLVGTLLRLQKG